MGDSMTARVHPSKLIGALVLLSAALLLSPQPAQAQAQARIQQGPKLLASDSVGFPGQGTSVAVSADGNTAIVGGSGDNGGVGAAWVYTRSGGVWTQQGAKLVGTGATGNASQGISVALSADGNTAILGGFADNSFTGAAWVFTRSGGVWTQQGAKLVGTGATGNARQGTSIALSADGNTAILGGNADSSFTGAAWVFTQSGGVWTQQGAKLVGTGAVGNAGQGNSVSLSANGNAAILGGSQDNSAAGAAWVFTRSGGVWTQQGNKLVGTGAVGSAQQGASVSLSADGNTAIVGGPQDDSLNGAAWVFTQSGGVWAQQGNKLVGTGAFGGGGAQQGVAIALSGDGKTAILGGPADNSDVGAAWIFTKSGGVWTQQGAKLVGTGAVGQSNEGNSVALSVNGSTAIMGGPQDNSGVGATWAFARYPAATHDFNFDGYSDVLWRDTSGDVARWLMQGTSILNLATSSFANLPTTWSIVGTGDFNGDGYADILWRDTSGDVAIWLMNGTRVLSFPWLGNVPTEWSIMATGDFNGDGYSDILWRDATGNVAMWEMNGSQIIGSNLIGAVPLAWSIVGSADFNGDGMSDVLWRDTSGNFSIWEMNGTTILNPATSFVAHVPTVWSIVGTGDFNGDGMSDILWHDTNGDFSILLMNGTTVLNQATSFVAQVPTAWSIFGSGDFNGDGMSDILWHDTNGNVAILEMNGTTILNQATSFVGQVSTVWSIQNPQGN
jgi:FG-GAP-like repeat